MNKDKVFCILSKYKSAFYNLAAEEYLFRNFKEDIFMLYINNPSIIVGKHQNAISEINVEFVTTNKIDVVRRLSGGGTVYHDEGNLNFSFITTSKDKKPVNFQKFTNPIIQTLTNLGLNVKLGKRNDISIDGLKVSGNAEHVFKNRVLHHGTLLFNSNLNNLTKALDVNLDRYEDKAVQSKRSRVVNIVEFLPKATTIQKFTEQIMLDILISNSANTVYNLSEFDIAKIDSLVQSKFATWEWNFGYSPKYIFKNTSQISDIELSVEMRVEKGIIGEVELLRNGQCTDELNEIAIKLKGLRHHPKDILPIRRNFPSTLKGVDILSFFF